MSDVWARVGHSDYGDRTIITEKLRVPGGWIYKVSENWGENDSMALCFVPENNHFVAQADD